MCFVILLSCVVVNGLKIRNLMDRWDPDKTILSSLFLQSETYFQDYAPYVNSYTEISSLIHKLMEVRRIFFFSFVNLIVDHRKMIFVLGLWSSANFLGLLTNT